MPTPPYRSDSEVLLLRKIVRLLGGIPYSGDSEVLLLRKIVRLLGGIPYTGDNEVILLRKIVGLLRRSSDSGDSQILLLRKIVGLLGGILDCCGNDTYQSLLFQWAQLVGDTDGDGIFEGSGEGLPPSPGACPGVVGLGTAEDFAVLGASTVTNTGLTVLNGDLGLYPGSSVTGFPPGVVNGIQHIANAIAAQAQLDLTTAYLDAEGRPGGIPVAGDIGGQTLGAGVYKSTSSLEISSGNLTLDGGGDPCAVFIFQIASTLLFTTGRQVLLTNGASAKNIFWQVGSSGTFQVTSGLKGTVMALASITAQTGAIVEGRLLARNAAVTLDTNSVTLPV